MDTSINPLPLRILIVEDEFIIGDMIARRLTKLGHTVVGHAFTYEEAIDLYHRGQPDLVLLDIRLAGMKTGVDVANYLRQQTPAIPHVYLTSQIDPQTMQQARNTYPAGYLTKPVQIKSLLTTIDIAMHNYRATQTVPTLTVKDGRETHILIQSTIQYLRSDHVYVAIHLQDHDTPIVCRATLGDLLEELQDGVFVRTHRSYAVNLEHVSRYDRECIHIGNVCIPISRTRRDAVLALM
ncbi:hypothetical protein LEM8419_02974 [Neolewinella maritima]|uniref:Response regulator transcription factor n=1 Tax=Neolewinella maritima TaxID=1383882 RepID=A0ABM9B3Z1_9BACT|nr:response regulator [Neolewinella maritima]CAH1002059.1 hypothetical protein LEM8419_02974 [Neolewinella maritima]